MSATKIGWTDLTLNPVIGCSHAGYEHAGWRKVAHPGCSNCYAEVMCSRTLPGFEAHNRCASGGKWTGKIEVLHERLAWPFVRKEYMPRQDGERRRCFLTSLSDMGHPALAESDWVAVQGMMILALWITWQDLTKRPDRQAELLKKHTPAECARLALQRLVGMGLDDETVCRMMGRPFMALDGMRWQDFAHIHRYVSVSDQSTADALIPLLLQMPCAVRGVSLEPMIDRVNIERFMRPSWGDLTPRNTCPLMPYLNHVIVGGESGRGARPFDLQWALDVIHQCKAGNVPCFVKQMGSNPIEGPMILPRFKSSKGDNLFEWPEALRVRQHVGEVANDGTV